MTQRCIGWPEAEVAEWLKARAEERGSDRIAIPGLKRKGAAV